MGLSSGDVSVHWRYSSGVISVVAPWVLPPEPPAGVVWAEELAGAPGVKSVDDEAAAAAGASPAPVASTSMPLDEAAGADVAEGDDITAGAAPPVVVRYLPQAWPGSAV